MSSIRFSFECCQLKLGLFKLILKLCLPNSDAHLFVGLHTYERLPATYLVMGLDFMVTADHHVWFIEANNYPLWPSNVANLDKHTYRMAVSISK